MARFLELELPCDSLSCSPSRHSRNVDLLSLSMAHPQPRVKRAIAAQRQDEPAIAPDGPDDGLDKSMIVV
jgi:hypothetical protein